jgi:hypothetical protein
MTTAIVSHGRAAAGGAGRPRGGLGPGLDHLPRGRGPLRGRPQLAASGAERARVEIGPTVHFATPASLGGTLVVGSGATIVAVTGV